jgi:cytoskeletal protein CcmA (bactofilin family)
MQPEAEAPPSRLGPGVGIQGVLEIDGELVISGLVKGRIAASKLVIAPGGYVEGDIVAREAVIGGRVHGSITGGERVELQTSAIVHGDIVTRRLLIQEGGSVNGSMKMEGELVQSALPENVHLAVNG